jgi:ABC-2 type transport system ATP-binding protein
MIKATNLTKTYKGGFTAVNDISFTVSEGEFFGFLGPNGAGKTTTMRILATLDRPTSGSVEVDGIDVVRRPHDIRKRIGFAMQSVGLDEMANARENLMLMGQLYGLSKIEAKKRCEDLLDLFSLKEAAMRFVSTYSGGMRRRLDVAVALMHRPKVLFLDEPTEGLDPAGRRIIWKYLQDLNSNGMTIFLTTHYMEEADFLVEKLAIINKGKLVAVGTPKDLKAGVGSSKLLMRVSQSAEARAQICEAYPGVACLEEDHTLIVDLKDGPAQVQRVFELMGQKGIAVEEFELRSPTLDDVFIKFTGERFEDEGPQSRDPYMSMRPR